MNEMKKLLLVLLVIIAGGALAPAQTQTRTSPDCILSFSLSSVTTSANLDNVSQTATGSSTGGCSQWIVVADGFNTAVATIAFQSSATSNAAGTAPGSFVTFAGTVSSGSNPTSTFPSTLVATGYYPWLRISMTAYTSGTVRGVIMGWREQSSTGGGGAPTDVVITNARSCVDSDVTLSRASITFTTATTTQIIAASGSTSITLCSLSLAASGTTNVSLVQGTGSNCATSPTVLNGSGYQQVLSVALDSPIPLSASQAFCITSSAAVNIGGIVTYTQQ